METIGGFNACMDTFNILETPAQSIAKFLDRYPTIYKTALVINHVFRAAMMVGFMFIPGIPFFPGMAVCLAGSLFYRLTVERNCAYKFAMPAFAGAVAFMLALPALINMINGVAFLSVATGFLSCLSFVPLALYGAYIVFAVNSEVNKTLARSTDNPCCSSSNQQAEECHCPV